MLILLALSSEEIYHKIAWWIGSTAAILTGLTIIWKVLVAPFIIKKIAIPLKQHVENIALLSDMAADLHSILPKLPLVVKAVLPNCGSSLPDAIGRLEVAVATMQAQGDTGAAITEALLWNHPKPMFRCTEYGENLFVNNAYADLLKTDVDSLKGINWRSYVHPDDLMKYDPMWNQAFKEKRSCWFQIRVIDECGAVIPVSVQFTVLRSGSNFCGFLGMMNPTHNLIDDHTV